MNKLKEYYFIYIPVLIFLLVYFQSVFFGFRNFDEDLLIKHAFVNKTFGEYVEKFCLLNLGGVSEAGGFTFSGIKNVHVSILGLPLFHTMAFLFKAKPFLYHLWGILLHSIALIFFIRFIYNFSQDKLVALFSGLLWTLFPTNVEPIIWATNWSQLIGAIFYFYTLLKVLEFVANDKLTKPSSIIFISLITMAQIGFTEHTITIPIAILITLLFKTKDFIKSIKVSSSSFLVIIIYWMIRNLLIEIGRAHV